MTTILLGGQGGNQLLDQFGNPLLGDSLPPPYTPPTPTDTPLTWWKSTILSQYANSPTLTQLIANLDAYVSPSANFDAFYDQIWNVLSAVGYGLDVWGRIVGVGRVLTLPVTGDYLGWQEALPNAYPWRVGFWFGGTESTQNFSLADEAFRILILAKGLANICDGSIPAINQILINLFGQTFGNSYCTDGGNMTMEYVFSSALDPIAFAIITESGVLPTPAGVLATVVQL